MKQGKLFIFGVIVAFIILVQPGIFQTVKQVLFPRSLSEQVIKKEDINSDEDINKSLAKKKFEGKQVIEVNNNIPTLDTDSPDVKNKNHWKKFSNLDILNRVGPAETLISFESLPDKKREDISKIIPTGWKNKQIVFNGKKDYLYNRCHLIAFELSGENANVRNLFTGTRALNANDADRAQSMVYYEDMIKDYIKTTHHRVLYQVTPIFYGIDLVAKGVRMQAKSIENDQISFDIFVFNVQPSYQINYLDGSSKKES